MRRSNDLPRRLARGLFTFAMALTWSGGALPSVHAAGAPAAATADPRKEKLAEVLRRSFKMAEQADRQIHRDTFDPQGVIDTVGISTPAIFEWVRDRTFYVPYLGALRGARGVLMDRRGNSLDRSLLLSELLHAAGQTTRLAHATLDKKTVADLIPKLRPPTAAEDGPVSPADSDAALVRLAAGSGIDPALVRPSLQKARMESDRRAAQTIQRATEQAATIAAMVPPAAAPVDGGAEFAAALSDHWWVQIESDGNWSDLDPLLPDSKAGQSLAKPAEELAPEDLPPEIWHAIKVKVVVEQLAAGHVAEHEAMSHTLRPADLIGSNILFGHRPTHWPARLDLSDDASGPARLRDAVLAQKEWLPVLMVDGQEFSDSTVSDTGDLQKADTDEPAEKLAAGAHQGFGGLGGGLAGGGGEAPKDIPQFTAEWIEYEFDGPGAKPLTIRRDVFDLIGPAARAAGKLPAKKLADADRIERGFALLDPIEMLPQVCQIPSEFVEHLMLQQYLASSDDMLYVMTGVAPAAGGNSSPARGTGQPPGLLYNLAAARFNWSSARDGLYFDRPNLLTHRTRVRVDMKGDSTYADSFDIVTNRLEALASSRQQSGALRLRQGVLDTCAEAALLSTTGGPVGNTSELLAESPSQHVEWIAIRKADDPGWKSVQMTDDVRIRATQDIAAGYVVLVPSKPVTLQGTPRTGWFRVDPATGETLGRMETGEGQALSERLMTHAIMGLISFSPTALRWQCKRMGSTSGACSPCAIAALSLLAGFIGLAEGVSAFVLSEKSAIVFFVWDVGHGGLGLADAAGPCIDSALHAGQ